MGKATCPRCGREHEEAELVLCAACRGGLRESAPGGEGTTTVQVGPILAEAAASAGPGEDIDEALLRVLKARYPEEATSLLSAVSRIVEMEARQSGEGKEAAIRRLAASGPGPEILLRRSGGRVVEGGFPTTVPGAVSDTVSGTVSETVSETQIIRVGGKEYGSLEEVPPAIRRAIEEARRTGGMTRRVVVSGTDRGMPRERKAGLKTGCSWGILAVLAWPVLRLLGR